MRSRRSVRLVVLLLALVAAPVGLDAAARPAFPAPPPAGRFVDDAAGLIGSEDASEIARLADALLVEKRYPISVVTIRSLAAQGADGYTIERYAAELLQSWRQDESMGKYGMLLLVAADDRKARIQLGSTWGHAHDERARKIMDRLILPAFRRGEFSKGILGGVRGFDALGRQLGLPMDRPSWLPAALVIDGMGDWTLPALPVEGLGEPWWALPALVVGGLVVLVGLVSLARRGRQSWAWAAAAFILGIFLWRLLRGSAEASDPGGGATGEW
jgi:uncharacterized protein